jgi:hypothetical protein
MMRRAAFACLLFLAPVGIGSSQNYPAAPLSPIPPRQLPSAGAIARWLSDNDAQLASEQLARAREDVYALIADRVRRRYASEKVQYPTTPDSVLAALYQLASRTGAIGARRVAHDMLPGLIRDETLRDSVDLELCYTPPLFTLRDGRVGWTVTFPYYFMISTLDRQVLADGNEYAVVMLSTLHAPNAAPDTSLSQATILIVASPGTSPASLGAFWARQMGVEAQSPSGQGGGSGLRYVGSDSATRLWKEFEVVPGRHGAVGVAYIGLEGTFELNRTHFVELLGRLEASLALPPN